MAAGKYERTGNLHRSASFQLIRAETNAGCPRSRVWDLGHAKLSVRIHAAPRALHPYLVTPSASPYLCNSIASTFPSTVLSEDSAYFTRAFIPLESTQRFQVPPGTNPTRAMSIFPKLLLYTL